MTALPTRPSSQSDHADYSVGPLFPPSGHLYSLPTTVFRLRNLGASAVGEVSKPEPQATNTAVDTDEPESSTIESASEIVDTPNLDRTRIWSQLTSQTLILAVVLLIAILGIVFGNRGTDSPINSADDIDLIAIESGTAVTPEKVSLTGLNEPNTRTVTARTETDAQSISSKPCLVTSIDPLGTQGQVSERVSLQSNGGTSVEPMTGQLKSKDISVRSDRVEPADLAVSTTASSPEKFTETAGPASVGATDPAPVGTKAGMNSLMSSVTHRLANEISETPSSFQAPPAAGNEFPSTDTPRGIDDWSRYFPTQASSPVISTKTPFNPIAGFQRYLQQLSAASEQPVKQTSGVMPTQATSPTPSKLSR